MGQPADQRDPIQVSQIVILQFDQGHTWDGPKQDDVEGKTFNNQRHLRKASFYMFLYETNETNTCSFVNDVLCFT